MELAVSLIGLVVENCSFKDLDFADEIVLPVSHTTDLPTSLI